MEDQWWDLILVEQGKFSPPQPETAYLPLALWRHLQREECPQLRPSSLLEIITKDKAIFLAHPFPLPPPSQVKLCSPSCLSPLATSLVGSNIDCIYLFTASSSPCHSSQAKIGRIHVGRIPIAGRVCLHLLSPHRSILGCDERIQLTAWLQGRPVRPGLHLRFNKGTANPWHLRVELIEPPSKNNPAPYMIALTTKVEIIPEERMPIQRDLLNTPAYQQLKMILWAFKTRKDDIRRFKIDLPKGLVLSGPPGVGKTHLIRVLAAEFNADLQVINGPELLSPLQGQAEDRLRSIFERAETLAKHATAGFSIIFIDEIDSIGMKRESSSSSSQIRLVAQLLVLMDGGAKKREGNVVVVGATNRPNVLDAALRRPGRFDREISIEPPTHLERLVLLQIALKNIPINPVINVDSVASRTRGYVAADLEALVRELVLHAVKTGQIEPEHVEEGLAKCQPSLIREHRVLVEPNQSWDDLGGLDELRERLQELVEWPLKHPDRLRRLGLTPPRGILLYGPPGCSKTTIAKILANSGGFTFYSLSGASIYSCLVGDSERLVRATFAQARMTTPAIIFIDEIDAIVGGRFGDGERTDVVQERILSTLLNEMDGVEALDKVLVLGATNRKDAIDPALLRPGRFDHLIEVPLPDRVARRAILQTVSRQIPLSADVDYEALSEVTEGYSGADLKGLVQEAAILALGEQAQELSSRHLYAALST